MHSPETRKNCVFPGLTFLWSCSVAPAGVRFDCLEGVTDRTASVISVSPGTGSWTTGVTITYTCTVLSAGGDQADATVDIEVSMLLLNFVFRPRGRNSTYRNHPHVNCVQHKLVVKRPTRLWILKYTFSCCAFFFGSSVETGSPMQS